MIVKLLTEHHLEFLSLLRGCKGSSESTHVKCQIVGISCHSSIILYLSIEQTDWLKACTVHGFVYLAG